MSVIIVRKFAHMLIGIDASRANIYKKTGVEWYAWHLIQNLKKIIPDNVRVVLYSREPLQGNLAGLPENWESRVLRWPPKRLWTQIRLSWEMLWHCPDVLFVPSHVPPLIHPKKTIMTIHDLAALEFPESYNWFERWYTIWSTKYAVRKLWKIIVPSNFVKSTLPNADNIQVVPHGYDKKYGKIYNQEKREKILKKYNIKRPFILSVGRLEEKKNTKRIIQAFNYFCDNNRGIRNQELEIRDFQLVLIGQPGYRYKEVRQEIIQSPHKHNIVLPGWVDPEDVIYIMNVAEVFVYPSLYEGFGLPVLEAMACGTPVVASHGSSLAEVGGDGVWYVESKDVKSIATGIIQALQNDKQREEKIRQGLKRAENFSWEASAAEIFNLFIN